MNAVASSAHVDGLRAGEVESELPCDRHFADPEDAYFRAIDVAAPAPVLFRWLCQLRAAPLTSERDQGRTVAIVVLEAPEAQLGASGLGL